MRTVVLTLLLQQLIAICTKKKKKFTSKDFGMAQMGFRQVPIDAGIITSITNLSNVRKRQIVSCCLANVL